MKSLSEIINLEDMQLDSPSFRNQCKALLDANGALVLEGFIKPNAINSIKQDGEMNQHLAFYTKDSHNIYLKAQDHSLPDNHPRNRKIQSSKGCITTDQIPHSSALHTLYNAQEFKDFLCAVLDEQELHEYSDPLSGINLHYASQGQELGWHYDNSSFAITLLVEEPENGGKFEYVKDARDADAGQMNYEQSADILDGKITPNTLTMKPGSLVLFRGRNSMHRVTPTIGDITRMLVVLAYNTEPGISLSESARMTFYGRLS